jgi:serine/threonine-protein kinase
MNQGVNQGGVSLPPAGTLVGGKYLLERYIAEGGMGAIASGRHVELDEPIALKFLKPEFVGQDKSGTLCGRFVREARATLKIKSEHVPRIFDVSTLPDGIPFIVMELLSGEDLDKRLEREGPMAVAVAVDVVMQSLEALAAAHALGMVHRDFKPANLFVSKGLDGSDVVKVLDFGIAKLVDQNGAGDQGLTGTSAVMGSPRYMAPEQMRSSRDVDARADVWAVGTTLYELLVGEPGFNGETLTQVCASILQDDLGSVCVRRPDVPPGLDEVVRRCTAKRASDRYANVAELAAALAPFGAQPTAYESARRVARVLGVAGRASDPGAHATTIAMGSGSTPELARPSYPGNAGTSGFGTNPGTTGSGATQTTWGTTPAGQPGTKKLWVIGSIAGVVVLSGILLGTVALLRSKSPGPQTSTGSVPQPTASATTPAIASALPTEAPEPSTTTTPTASAAAAPTAVASTPKTKTSDPKTNATSPKTSTKPTTKPTSPSGGGLWDDRK